MTAADVKGAGHLAEAMPKHKCGHYGVRNRAGNLCGQNVTKGTQRCRTHSGKKLGKAKAEGAVILEVHNWGLDDSHVDPGETLLRLLAQSAARVRHYAALLESAFMDKQVAALVGVHYVVAADEDDPDAPPKAVASGEYIRGLAELEADERDRCARFAKLALDAGIAERQVRIAELMGAGLITVLTAALVELGQDPAEERVRSVVAAQLSRLELTASGR